MENIALKALENLHLKRPTHSIFNLDKTGPDCRSKKPIHSSHPMAPFLFQDAKPTQVKSCCISKAVTCARFLLFDFLGYHSLFILC